MDVIPIVVVFGFLTALAFMTVVAPIWIGVRYTAKKREAEALAGNDRTELQRLAEAEVAMRDRIAALESILDAETPAWRRGADRDGACGPVGDAR